LAFDNKLKEIGKIFSGEKQEEIPEKETSQQKREEKPQEIEEPTFTEGFDVVQFTFGSNSLMYNIADLERTKQKFIVADNPLFLYVEDGKPYVDVDIYNVPFQPTVRLQRNKIMNRPANWDMNSDKTALEIVDEERKPVFQLYYKKPSHIVINGFFNINGIIVLASEKETVMNLLEVPTNTLEPIFRYPALEHRGERC